MLRAVLRALLLCARFALAAALRLCASASFSSTPTPFDTTGQLRGAARFRRAIRARFAGARVAATNEQRRRVLRVAFGIQTTHHNTHVQHSQPQQQGLRLLVQHEPGQLAQALLAWRQSANDEIRRAYGAAGAAAVAAAAGGGGGGVALNLQGLYKRVRRGPL
jgi:hypothetical protein